jgi:hypothetical protein
MDLSLPIAVQRIGLMMPKDLADCVINGVIVINALVNVVINVLIKIVAKAILILRHAPRNGVVS